jgi:hypothetical protein
MISARCARRVIWFSAFLCKNFRFVYIFLFIIYYKILEDGLGFIVLASYKESESSFLGGHITPIYAIKMAPKGMIITLTKCMIFTPSIDPNYCNHSLPFSPPLNCIDPSRFIQTRDDDLLMILKVI